MFKTNNTNTLNFFAIFLAMISAVQANESLQKNNNSTGYDTFQIIFYGFALLAPWIFTLVAYKKFKETEQRQEYLQASIQDEKFKEADRQRQEYLQTPMLLFAKNLTGQTRTLTLKPSDKVGEIIDQLARKYDEPKSDELRIIFAGKQLAKDRRLIDYNIPEQGTFNIICGLKGN